MSAADSTLNSPRTTPNATNAFLGVLRLSARRIFSVGHWLTLAGLLVVLAYLSSKFPFMAWTVDLYLGVLVPIFAFITAGGAMRDDLKAETTDYVFTRPVRRPAYVFFRFLAHVICVQPDFLLAFAVLISVGSAMEIPDVLQTVPILLLAQTLTVVAFSAFGILCAMITTRYAIMGLVYGAIVEVGVGHIPTQLNRISITHGIKQMLLQLGEQATRTEPAQGAFATTGMILAYAAVVLAISAAIFTLRELSGARPAAT